MESRENGAIHARIEAIIPETPIPGNRAGPPALTRSAAGARFARRNS